MPGAGCWSENGKKIPSRGSQEALSSLLGDLKRRLSLEPATCPGACLGRENPGAQSRLGRSRALATPAEPQHEAEIWFLP